MGPHFLYTADRHADETPIPTSFATTALAVPDRATPRQLAIELRERPAPAVAQRVGWPYSGGPLKKLLSRVRPEYKGVDALGRVAYEPGQVTQCDL